MLSPLLQISIQIALLAMPENILPYFISALQPPAPLAIAQEI